MTADRIEEEKSRFLNSPPKYVVKHKSAKLLKTYAVGKLDAALNISHLILTPSCRHLIFPILGVSIHIFGLVGDKLRHF